MQFALPPRKSPHAHPYPRSSRLSFQRRRQLKAAAVLGFALLSILFLASHFFSSSDTESAAILSSAPEVVLVTVFDRDVLSKSYIEKVKKNREYYAARHGKHCPSVHREIISKLIQSKATRIFLRTFRTTNML